MFSRTRALAPPLIVLAVAWSGQPLASPNSCYYSYGAECNAATAAGINANIQSSTSIQQLLVISNVLGSVGNRGAGLGPRVSLDGQTGLAAAGPGSRWNGWVSGAHNRIAYNWEPLRSAGKVENLIGGIDYRWDDKLTVGISAGLDRTRVSTGYNGGSLTGDGYSLVPYASYQFNQTWSLDAALGFGRNELRSVDRTAGAAITGDSRSERTFGAMNLSWTRWFGQMQVIAKGSYIDSSDATGRFTLSNGVAVPSVTQHLTQARAGLQLGLWQAAGWMPWVAAHYVVDITAPTQANPLGAAPGPANDRTGYVLSAGADIYSKGPVSGGVLVSSDAGRDQRRMTTLMANLLFRF